ncbi:FadR/GntR family transcriptional regulator [Danxiaibacter flavus]|uniref:FadR/GntR family transcriptional regulator n=1 Tax=Danxiaibacter flavus TaxID=3049108 RepID=A0ABV3ZKE0_9BACT|nr:FadR/GntR family transcriptional regulator [Chitinophagaceae bacterium DXS]
MMNSIKSPLKRKSLADEVAERLQQDISAGNYSIGEKLPTEPELMQQFGVGRSSIREAVRILANAGFITVQQGLGTFVASKQATNDALAKKMQKAQFEDLNEVRSLLEVKIAGKAALKRTTADIIQMKAFLKQRKIAGKQNKPEACIQADIDFHTSIAVASQNEILVELYKTIATHLKQSFIERYNDTTAFVETQGLHESLLQSIIDKDEKKAFAFATRITTR